jgi:hypothetical protein
VLSVDQDGIDASRISSTAGAGLEQLELHPA